jgi:hypothetical protein
LSRPARLPASHERRRRLRFPLSTELRFEAYLPDNGKPVQGTGQAENMSSVGLAFRSTTPVPRGARLTVSLAWPAKLDNECLLRMVFDGDVVRTEGDLVVITIERYEFRTSGKGSSAARNEVAGMVRNVEMHLSSRVMEPNTWAKRTAPY